MNTTLGTDTLKRVFFNDADVKKIYLDENKVWSRFIELTDDKYKMEDLYPQKYFSMTEFPTKDFDSFALTTMAKMFNNCRNLKALDLSCLDVLNVKNIEDMFFDCNNLETIIFPSNFKNMEVTSFKRLFTRCYKLVSLDMSQFNTESLTNMSAMLIDCRELTSLDFSKFNTSKVTNMESLFHNCYKLAFLDLSNFNTSKVTNMKYMFSNCNFKFLNISSFNTSNVTNMDGMFTGVKGLESLNLSHFNTSKVTSTANMFKDSEFKLLDFSNKNLSNVVNMTRMFANSLVSSVILSNIKLSGAIVAYRMFDTCRNLKTVDLSNTDTSCITEMDWMFYDCPELIEVKGIIDMKSCKSYRAMFFGCSKVKNVKIKNPTIDINVYDSDGYNAIGLKKSQFTIVS